MFFSPVFPLVVGYHRTTLSNAQAIRPAPDSLETKTTTNQQAVNNRTLKTRMCVDVIFFFLPDRIKNQKTGLQLPKYALSSPEGYKGKHQEHRLSTRRKITNGWLRVKSIHHVKQAGTDLQRESWTRPTRVETSGNNRVALLVNSFNASLSVKVN